MHLVQMRWEQEAGGDESRRTSPGLTVRAREPI